MEDCEQELFQNLMHLCETTDSFYFVDKEYNGELFRVFNYRLVSWTEMQLPDAKNCRGTTFQKIENNWRIVSFTPEKFFNLEEGGVDHTPHTIGCSMEKLDGSLISTVEFLNTKTYQYQWFLKSKTSFDSEQSRAAMEWISKEENSDFRNLVLDLINAGFTVNMEWTSPDNRIVVPYQESKLTILNVRSVLNINDFGETIFGEDLIDIGEYSPFYNRSFFVEYKNLDTTDHSIFQQMKQETEGEGYVVEIQHPEGSYLVKVKNERYLTLHNTKDSVNTPKKLFEAVIMETTDDLRGMFADDEHSLKLINDMEQYVVPKYNHIIHMVEDFHSLWKDQDRKTYAIAAQNKYPEFMGLCMNLYLGKTNDYKAFAIKNVETIFGVTNNKSVIQE